MIDLPILSRYIAMHPQGLVAMVFHIYRIAFLSLKVFEPYPA